MLVAAADSTADAKHAAAYACDGHDDEVEINAAIAALPPAGGRVTLAAGTYNLGSTVVIDRDRVNLQGEGYGFWAAFEYGNPGRGVEGDGITKLRATATGFDLVVIDRTTSDPEGRRRGIRIADLYLYGAGTGDGIRITAAAGPVDQCIVERLFIHHAHNGLTADGGWDAGRIINSTFMDIGGHAIHVRGPSYYPIITHNCVADIGGGSVRFDGESLGTNVAHNSFVRSSFGVRLAHASFALVTSNVVSECRGVAIALEGCADATVQGNVVKNEQVVEPGMAVGLEADCRNVLVANNVVAHMGGASDHPAIAWGPGSTGLVHGNAVRGEWGPPPLRAGGADDRSA